MKECSFVCRKVNALQIHSGRSVFDTFSIQCKTCILGYISQFEKQVRTEQLLLSGEYIWNYICWVMLFVNCFLNYFIGIQLPDFFLHILSAYCHCNFSVDKIHTIWPDFSKGNDSSAFGRACLHGKCPGSGAQSPRTRPVCVALWPRANVIITELSQNIARRGWCTQLHRLHVSSESLSNENMTPLSPSCHAVDVYCRCVMIIIV